MATTTITVTYADAVTPKKTTFLEAKALDLKFESDIELEGSDGTISKTIENEFAKEMKSRVKEQLKHLDTWLSEKDKLISEMMETYKTLEKMKFPETPAEAKSYVEGIKTMRKIAEKVDELTKDYAQIVDDWATNVAKQQGLVATITAVKKARVTVWDEKKTRVRLGAVVKGILIVTGIALAVAATVLSAGATAPAFIALAAIGVSLSGISSIVSIGKSVKDTYDMEKRLLKTVAEDVKKTVGALKGGEGSIDKHVTELQNLLKKHEDDIKTLQTELKKYQAIAKGYQAELNKIGPEAIVDAKERSNRETAIVAVQKDIDKTLSSIANLEKDNQKGEKLLKELEDLGADLKRISTQVPNTILGNLKERFTSLEGINDTVNQLGQIVSGASGCHH
jgi:uncharacterized protein YhaN